MKGPFSSERVVDGDGVVNWRIADGDDNRVATCFDPANADMLVVLLSRRVSAPHVALMRAEPVERFEIGDGFILARGNNLGPRWLGVAAKATDVDPAVLTLPTPLLKQVDGQVIEKPETRRRYRLVLEVVQEKAATKTRRHGGGA